MEPPAVVTRGAGTRQVEVEVLYATDRARTGSLEPNEFYGGGRGELEYGRALVTLPRTHERGELESPQWWKLEFTEDPGRHIVLRSLSYKSVEEFRNELSQRTSLRGQSNVLVFVHGFNVAFSDAVRRTAQIAYDLRFPGVPITYSWPSLGSATPLAYTTDENNVEYTEPHLRRFLTDLKKSVGADVRIHLIAHSMGNRALTRVLRSLAPETTAPAFSQLILAAPDIDRTVFERDIAPAILKTAHRTTLYASSQDNALLLSMKVHEYPRAGQSIAPLVFVEGLDTVDATGIDTSVLGHSYVAVPLLLNDLFMLIRHDLQPKDRKLRGMPGPPASVRYWSFQR